VNVFLWILQAVLATAFGLAGLTKAFKPKEKLRTTMPWVDDFTPTRIRLIGVVEVLGALGLVLPAVTGVAPVLTPLAAIGLAVTMVGAAVVHARRGEWSAIAVNVVLLVLAAVVAWGRLGAHAL
jgi:uncharacterized membrane protein